MKKILIINGNPGSGKTLFEKKVAERVNSTIFSSIDPVKEFYTKYFGWNGEKKDENREFLSNMKNFLTRETSILEGKMVDQYADFWESDKEILMIDIREISQIEIYKEAFNAHTVFVDNPRVPTNITNPSDAQVAKYEYDYMISNSGSKEDLDVEVERFLKELSNGEAELFFEASSGVERSLGVVETMVKAQKIISDFLEERNFVSHYSRAWPIENDSLKFDVGSHTEFFIIKNVSNLKM